MRVVIAPDSFKGSLSAPEAAAAMARGVRAVFPGAELALVPVADGGEGTVEALVAATGGRLVPARATGPLGEPVEACWGVLGDGATAAVEAAAASGLSLVPAGRRDPRRATSRGTGDLLRAALDAGLRRVVLGIGGTACNDGGAGLARAMGIRFLDGAGEELPEGGAALGRIERIDLGGADPRLHGAEVLVACDVTSPLTGPHGASAVYGPQKGASPADVAELDLALARYARAAAAATGREVAELPGAGAGGGLAAGLLFFTPARLRPGAELVLEAVKMEAQLRGADLVLTGEGRTDAQTALGKAPAGVAALARRMGVPVICLSGGLGEGAEQLLGLGVDALASTAPAPISLDEALRRAPELLEAAAARACRLVQLGMRLGSGRTSGSRSGSM